MNNENFYVYIHRRLITGAPFYIGKGRGDRAHSRRGRNQYWNRIVSKDGGFTTSFLAKGVDEEFAMLAEKEAIDVLRRRGHTLANITDGGDGVSGWKHTEQSRAKLSAAGKGKAPWNKGKKYGEEARRKMSESRRGRVPWNKGKHPSDETRMKMSAASKGRQAWNKGRPISKEHVQKLVASHVGRPPWNKGIKMPEAVRLKVAARLIGNTFRRGKTASDEARARMSAAGLARWARVKARMAN